MDSELKYRISLQDLFSQGIKHAEENAHHFENAVDGIGDHLNELKNQIMAAVGVFELFEFGKGAAESFIEMQHATEVLRFTVGKRGGLTKDFEDLTEQSEKLGKSSFFNHVEIKDAANQLLNFGVSVKQTKESLQALTDVGVAKNKSLSEVIQAVGMAASGGRAMALKEYGLGYLKLEKDMSVAGAEARNFQKIIGAMGKEFSGATGQMQNFEFFKMKKIKDEFEEFKELVGKNLMKAFDALLPTIKKVMQALMDLGHWLKQHSEIIKTIATAIAAMIIAYETYKGVLAAVEIGQGLLNAAMSASPIGALIVSIGLATLAWQNYQKATKSASQAHEDAKNDLIGNREDIEKDEGEFVEKRTKKLVDSHKAASEEAAKYKTIIDEISGLEKQMKEQMDMFNKDKNGFSVTQGGRDTMTLGLYNRYKIQLEYLKKLKSEIDNKGKGGPGGEGSLDLGSELSTPKASKIQNITINLNNPFSNQKVTMQGGLNDIKNIAPQFTEYLISLVEDAAIVAAE